MTTETKIIAEPEKQELFIIREFDAARELVFKAFTTPEILEKFFGFHFIHHDYRPGGSYRWCNKDKNGKVVCTFYGVIHDIHFTRKNYLHFGVHGNTCKRKCCNRMHLI